MTTFEIQFVFLLRMMLRKFSIASKVAEVDVHLRQQHHLEMIETNQDSNSTTLYGIISEKSYFITCMFITSNINFDSIDF